MKISFYKYINKIINNNGVFIVIINMYHYYDQK